ncbi:MAG: histidine kinase, partial [Saprospiraceae bacterium]|nr:histidine kinase [Saprospiraceae bacterium]
ISWLKPKDKSAQGQHPERIIDFILDRSNSNVLWLGSYHGLFSYDINSNKYTHFSTSPKDIHVMSQDQEGLIWIAIRNSTILHSFNPADQSWNQFPLDKNLPDMEYIHEIDILPDDQKWISTNHHVGIFNPQTNEYTAWQLDSTNVDGLLPQGDYYDILNDRHGRLWIGSWYGVQYAKGAFVIPNPIKNPAEVIIVELQSNNERADREKPLICTDHYDLLKDQRDFEIKYVLPNPLDPADVEYRYKLEGYDKDWIATRSRTARYSRITGGNYLFLVQGREGEDSYTETTSLSVSVEKKLSEFWWFWALCISGVTAMTTGGLWFRITGVRRAEKLKAKFEQDMAEIKMQALRAQMNPHFLFNCLNSIKYYAISKDKDATADYLSKFSLLVRTILNNSKSDKVALNDELEAIRLYIEIENLRLENKFNYEIEIDPSIKTTNIQIPPMVLQPYVENAIWHGLMHKNGKGQLKVQVKDLGNAIQCIVEDNGIGRQKSAQIAAQQPQIKKSMGMQITSDRLKLIREIHHVEIDVKVVDLTDSQGLTAGTKVIVEFPHPANDL